MRFRYPFCDFTLFRVHYLKIPLLTTKAKEGFSSIRYDEKLCNCWKQGVLIGVFYIRS